MRRIDAERYLDYPKPGYMEALRETAIAEMQFDCAWVHPAWKAWTKCPLFLWLKKRRRQRELADLNYENFARALRLKWIDGKLSRTAIIRKDS